jgi:3-oxoacyl-[acyl-carrier protein] reductase
MGERDLQGRVALVTGGGRDMGRAIALELARRGADVAIGYHASAATADETVGEIVSLGVRGLAVAADVRETAEVEALAAAAEEFGGGRVDILVNNAGGLVRRSPFAEVTPELLEETLRLNFLSASVACHALIPGMAERGYGRIVNIGSVAAHTGNPTNHHYAAAKAALTSLARSLTKEYAAAGITINTIAPGLIDNAFHTVHTPRPMLEEMIKTIPAARAGTNEDVAAAVAFLASEGAGYITGDILHVNGGLYVPS